MKELKPCTMSNLTSGASQVPNMDISDGDANDYYWETTNDQRVPRRLDEGTSTEKNFIMNTYQVR
jgi:hypothetical protein